MQNIKTVFLDRDGVINVGSDKYIKDWAEFNFVPKSLEAIENLTACGFDLYIITNQSGINRGLMSINALKNIHDNMLHKISLYGGKIKDIFFCPHTPKENCNCRKPKIGLIKSAQEIYNIDLNKACMIGDWHSDIECANNAEIKYSLFIKADNYNEALRIMNNRKVVPSHTFDNLFDASSWLIDQQ